MDITGWEEGGLIRVYRNPGQMNPQNQWPAVTVGEVKSPEDAVFVDLDSDGSLDVVSSCEGKTRTMFVHWAPKNREDYLKPDAWKTEPIPVTKNMTAWMFALPADINDDQRPDLLVGSKNPNGRVGWLEAPENPRSLKDWKYHHIEDCGWIMSLREKDLYPGGGNEFIVSDRKGKTRGVFALSRTNQSGRITWKRRNLTDNKKEYMFIDVKKWNDEFIFAIATRNKLFEVLKTSDGRHWTDESNHNPFEISNGKAMAIGDIDLDGNWDLVHTTNTRGMKDVPGVSWLKPTKGSFKAKMISKIGVGKKFDRIELLDLDQDSDLDVITCEEADNLGVIWYENPTR